MKKEEGVQTVFKITQSPQIIRVRMSRYIFNVAHGQIILILNGVNNVRLSHTHFWFDTGDCGRRCGWQCSQDQCGTSRTL